MDHGQVKQSQPQPLTGNFYGQTHISGGTALLGDNYGLIQIQHDASYFRRLRLLDSLKYPDMNARLNGIRDNEFETFEWVFQSGYTHQKAALSLREWLISDAPFFFIEGKAGSGKSTFMKFLFQHRLTQSNLQEWSANTPVTLLFHSFWLVGTLQQSSLKGLLASLLHQVLSKHLDLLDTYCQQDQADMKSSFSDWSEKELYTMLKRCLDSATTPLCLFLDGIDEFDQNDDIDRLFDLLDGLHSMYTKLKICLSSRPLRHIKDRFKAAPSVRLQDLTAEDIEKYVQETLEKKLSSPEQVDETQEKISTIVSAIRRKANGVFLWVYCVLKNVCAGIRIADELDSLLKRIEKLPSEMEKLYYHMWLSQNSENEIHIEEARRLFKLFRSTRYIAARTLPLLELTVSMDQRLRNEYLSNPQPLDELRFNEICLRSANQIVSRSAGLLECITNSEYHPEEQIEPDRQWALWGPRGPETAADRTWRCTRVQYFHRSVYDFLEGTPEGQAIVQYPSSMSTDLHSAIVISRLANFIEDVEPFMRSRVGYMIHDLTYGESEPDFVLQLIDQTFQSLIEFRSKGLAVNVKRWTSHLGHDFPRSEDFDHYCLDFPNLVVSYTSKSSYVSCLLKSRGATWSRYYKAYVSGGILTRSPGKICHMSDLLEMIHILIDGGADLESRQICFASTKGSIHHRFAVDLLRFVLISILSDDVEPQNIASMMKLVETAGTCDMTNEQLTIFLLLDNYSGRYSDYEYRALSSVTWFDSDQDFLIVFSAREVYNALCHALSKCQADYDEDKYEIENAKLLLQGLLIDLPKNIYRYKFGDNTRHSGILFEEWDPALFLFFFGKMNELQQELERLKPFPDDVKSPNIQNLDFCDTRVRDFNLLPLDPEQEIGAHEWKEKGIMRDYFAKLRKLEPDTEKTTKENEDFTLSRTCTDDSSQEIYWSARSSVVSEDLSIDS